MRKGYNTCWAGSGEPVWSESTVRAFTGEYESFFRAREETSLDPTLLGWRLTLRGHGEDVKVESLCWWGDVKGAHGLRERVAGATIEAEREKWWSDEVYLVREDSLVIFFKFCAKVVCLWVYLGFTEPVVLAVCNGLLWARSLRWLIIFVCLCVFRLRWAQFFIYRN